MYSYSLAIFARLWVVSLNLWEFCLIYVIYKVILQTTTTIFDNSYLSYYLNKQYNKIGSKYVINIKKTTKKNSIGKITNNPFLVLMISIMKNHFHKIYINQDLNYFRKYWKIFRNFDEDKLWMIANISLY